MKFIVVKIWADWKNTGRQELEVEMEVKVEVEVEMEALAFMIACLMLIISKKLISDYWINYLYIRDYHSNLNLYPFSTHREP